MNIETIDYDNKRHKTLIMTLSKKNNYYYDEFKVHILQEIPSICQLLFTEEHNKKILMNMNAFYSKEKNYKGYIMFIKKVAIGFIMYYDNDNYNIINYLLIDKDYQLKGCGKALLKYFLKKSNNKIIEANQVLDNSVEFYIKNGFKENYELMDELIDEEKIKILKELTITKLLKNEINNYYYYKNS
jgi:GNAT superfamily N-acetyltransferase